MSYAGRKLWLGTAEEGLRVDAWEGPEDVLRRIERATNAKDFDEVARHLDSAAVYWFTDGSFRGLVAIREAFERTWRTIQDEAYTLSDIRWVIRTDTAAVCVYNFRSQGTVDGRPFDARGRGTNVLHLCEGAWKVVHEHLSRAPADA